MACCPVAGFCDDLCCLGGEKHKADKSANKQERVEVTVVTVKPADTPVSFEYVAQVESSRQVNIQARVSGFLEKRIYTEGRW